MDSIGILARYAALLEVVASAPDGLSLTEIIARTDLPRGTAHRLVNTLMSVGYLGQKDGRKIYVLGSNLLRLLRLGATPTSVATLARPILERLVARVGETVFLAKLTGDRVETILAVAPDSERQSFVYPGRDMPLHAAASGKAILAFQREARIGAFLARPREKFTAATKVGARKILDDLRQVRARGYGICDGEFEPGVLSYASPIALGDAGVIYSVGVVALASRLRAHAASGIVAALREAGEEFAERLERHDALPATDAAGLSRPGSMP